MKRRIFALLLGLAASSCGPLTDQEKGGDLEFKVDLQNDADVPISLKVVFDRCKIDADKALAVAAAKQRFMQTFVGKCETNKDYDDNEESIELSSTSGKHDVVVSSGCRDAVTCNNDGCTAKLDANCKEQPMAKSAPASFR